MLNVVMRQIAMPLLARCPLVISHQGFYSKPGKSFTAAERAKILATRFARKHTPPRCCRPCGYARHCYPNAYNSEVFCRRDHVRRDKDVLFVGRLVEQKAADVVIKSLALLRKQGRHVALTIAGDGPTT